ncbi:MAG: efflux RND transporter periplasmic adaptor subunit [Pseudomonadales bacterium]
MKNLQTRPAAVLFAWLLGLQLIGCSEPEVTAPDTVARPVKILTYGSVGNTEVVEYSGTVAAAQSSDMAFEVPGRITEFVFSAGDRVEEGAVLARLDASDYESALDKARADRNAAQADFKRYEQAYNDNAVTKQDLDLAKRNLEVSEALLRTADKAVADTELRAPFSGNLARKLVNDFANVQAKQPVLVLQDESSLEIDVNVPEQDWARAKPGLDLMQRSERAKPQVIIPAIANRQFPARLQELNTTADPVTRTYAITFAFDKPEDLNVRPGMTGLVKLTIPTDVAAPAAGGSSATLPAAAVLADTDGAPFVWVVGTDMTVQKQTVTVGELAHDRIKILSGLDAGTQIVASGVHSLRAGMVVRRFEP